MAPTRLVTPDDAEALAGLARTNRGFLAPWEPSRSENWYTSEGHRAGILEALDRHAQGWTLPHVIVDADDGGRIVGRMTLNGIVRGPFLSCSVGYWVGAVDNGRGLATAAMGAVKRVAFEELGLHRIQAETLLDNAASQVVLSRHGFVRFGMAPAYLNVGGRWQDHVMYQVLNDA